MACHDLAQKIFDEALDDRALVGRRQLRRRRRRRRRGGEVGVEARFARHGRVVELARDGLDFRDALARRRRTRRSFVAKLGGCEPRSGLVRVRGGGGERRVASVARVASRARVSARRFVRARGLGPRRARRAVALFPHAQLELGAARLARRARVGLVRGERGTRLVDHEVVTA